MHPNRAFAWEDRAGMLAFVADVAFAQICAVAAGRPMVAHAPLEVSVGGGLRFHLARNNPIVRHLAGEPVLAVVMGEHFYVSPDWYGTADQVPTWNYRAVECEGIARQLDEVELRDQINRLSMVQERRLAPKPEWTSGKMSPPRLAAMLRGIVGFSIDTPVLRGVAKLGQNKSAAEASGAAAGLRTIGRASAAVAMEAVR